MQSRVGLLLVNLGSPDSTATADVRRYLAEFLHDHRVIDTTRWIWCPILHGVILRVRPARSAKAYKKIWEWDGADKNDEAPLIRITRQQASGIQDRLGDAVKVETAMRYGNPSIAEALSRLQNHGCDKIAVLPLYPQYAGATTASAFDGVAKGLKGMVNTPEIRVLRDYHVEPGYIAALAKGLNEHLGTLDWSPDVILASYHGLPQSYVDKGDPYQRECVATTDALRDLLNLDQEGFLCTFQSRFGPKAWLQPYTDKVLEGLPAIGKKKVAVMMPGFAADCLETLEEIDMEARETFLDHGGENFTAVPCLNASSYHVEFLAGLAKDRLLCGWL